MKLNTFFMFKNHLNFIFCQLFISFIHFSITLCNLYMLGNISFIYGINFKYTFLACPLLFVSFMKIFYIIIDITQNYYIILCNKIFQYLFMASKFVS